MASKSVTFNNWWNGYERTGSISPVQLGMTRDEIRVFFGEPDDTSISLRRRNPLVGIWKFGRIEFHFDTDGRLWLIYTEQQDGLSSGTIAKSEASSTES